ncbi:hypothetical protein [Zhaonella formicivorans]|nr:hypothetical protein [Zhaonella formicivorans]
MKKEKKFTKEQVHKARDYQLTYSETYVEPRGMKDNPMPEKEE